MSGHFANSQSGKWPENFYMNIIVEQDFYWAAEWFDDDDVALDLDGYSFRIQIKRGDNTMLDYSAVPLTAGVSVSEIAIAPEELTNLSAGQAECLIWAIDPTGFKRLVISDVAVIHNA